MPQIAERGFSAGEIAPQLYGRVDQNKYSLGLRTCRNQVVMRHGGIVSRPGTQFVAEVGNSANPVRLIPFIFNQSGGQTFALELGVNSGGTTTVRFYQGGAQILESVGTITGYTQASQIVITEASHGYSTGDEIVIEVGMAAVPSNNNPLNGRNYLVVKIDNNSYYITDKNGNYINSTLFPAYGSFTVYSQRVYTLKSALLTYQAADFPFIKFSQSADVITLTHPNYIPIQIARTSNTSWTVTQVVTQSSVGPCTNVTFAATPPGTGWSGTYTVVAVLTTGEMSPPASAALNNVGAPTASVYHSFNWGPPAGVTNVAYYNIYLQIGTYLGTPAAGGGFIGSSAAANTYFNNYGISPDYSNTFPQSNTLFNSTNNYPACTGFAQQRQLYANTNNNPIGVWGSQPGFYLDFNFHSINPPDSDPIVFSPLAEQINAIQHIVQLRDLILLTQGAEIVVNQGLAALTPSQISCLAASYYGAGPLKPINIGEVCIFQQNRGWSVRDLGYDFAVDGYRGNDLTIFAPHLVMGYTLTDWAFQLLPHSIIWAARSDGALLGLTYLREQQILAWHRHDMTNGFVENVCSVPESPEDGIYLCVRRTINGVTKRYIERLSAFYWSDIINASSMDSFLKYDGTNYNNGFTMTLSGGTKWDETEKLILTASQTAFTSAMVGQQIFIRDTDRYGLNGNEVRLQILSVSSSTIATVQSDSPIPTSLQGQAPFWAVGIQTVGNLWTLQGQTVSVWADRTVVGSPNNTTITNQYTVNSNGQITLDKCYSMIYVGLPIISDMETLDIDTAFGESLMDTQRQQLRIALYLYNSRTFFTGTQNPDTDINNTNDDPLFNLFEAKSQEERQTYTEPPYLLSQVKRVEVGSRWNKNGRGFVRHIDPLPLSILSIATTGLFGKPNEWQAYTKV